VKVGLNISDFHIRDAADPDYLVARAHEASQELEARAMQLGSNSPLPIDPATVKEGVCCHYRDLLRACRLVIAPALPQIAM